MALKRLIHFCLLGLALAGFPGLALAQVSHTVFQVNASDIDLAEVSGKTVLTVDGSVKRARYVRYHFNSTEWNEKVGPSKNLQGNLIMALELRPMAPAKAVTLPSQPKGGIQFDDFAATITEVYVGNPALVKQVLVYQGLLPTASGPGMEVQLYLYRGGESYVRFTYVEDPARPYVDFGTWSRQGSLLQVRSINTDGFDLNLQEENSILYLYDTMENERLYQDIDQACLVRISR